ncbi:MAG: response regulator [Christiangramia sp.]|uniref:Protein containing response regulator receiver domain n=1 Tax=Christiangramia flava JLT2011 TaxID=1229726 RepID=A0A1L7I9X9_9FLAO|nr:response regulator [Christiangramia flava]APU70024.1 Protein containing response regulator receiver domain [Christiangramia flava JLT2011]MAM17834.1 two-component system response regulator [Christiangramia sp.]OSS39509.1 protein containing response regulator receiver d omain [Christiangramia flava JLT2011]
MARILIVDDDQTIGLMLKDILEFNGHEVKVSQEPRRTKEILAEYDAELILLDKLISGVDGTDVCADLKRDDRFEQIPVIMMSALHNVNDICKEAGATEFLAKPFDMSSLTDLIDRVLSTKA